jgi:HK97 family phage major capsid protein
MSDETTTTTPVVDWQPGDETKAGRRMAGGMLEKAKTALATFAELVKWAAYDDEEDAAEGETEEPEEPAKAIDLVTVGPAVKALGDGRIGGYLVMFGTPDTPDLTGDYFAPDTDFDLDDGMGKSTVLYHHGQDPTLKRRKLGRAALRTDNVGVWIEAQLRMRDEYERAIYGLAEEGKMGWSSGTAPHLVEREAQGGVSKITRWPLGLDASITPIPAEPRIRTMPLKSYLDTAEPYVKAILPQAAQPATAANATQATPEPKQHAATSPQKTMEYPEMTNEEMQAMIAQAVKQAADDAIKAYEEKQPPINPGGFATQPATVKDKPEGFKSLGEQLIAVKNAALGYSYDRRLDGVKAILGGNESVPSEGGFLVQTEQAAGLDKKVWDVGVFASRAQQRSLAAGANSADFYGVSENSRANGSRYGGITGYRVAEGAEITASGPQKFYKYTLKPKEYAVVAYLTNEVLNDARLLEQELSSGAVAELAFMLDDDMFRGLGVAGAYGWTIHPSAITVSKETGQAADTITYKNILQMWKRRWPRGRYTWFVNQDAEDQLDLMYQAAGTAGIAPRFVTYGEDSVMRIKGAPVVVTEFNSGIGDLGDIVLADWSQYKLATIGGVDAASSMHVQFLTNQMAYRFIRRVDGQPTWQKELTPYKGTANTMSPFIMLEAR